MLGCVLLWSYKPFEFELNECHLVHPHVGRATAVRAPTIGREVRRVIFRAGGAQSFDVVRFVQGSIVRHSLVSNDVVVRV
jgi:hypothetical protein